MMKWLGSAELKLKLQQLAAKQPKRVGGALFVRANMIMLEAKRRCPLGPEDPYPGTLRASGQVHPPEIHGKDVSVMLSFGGAATAYALAVHEHLSEHSPYSWRVAEERGTGVHWSTPGTGPKFLEQPINEARNDLDRWLAAKLRLDQP